MLYNSSEVYEPPEDLEEGDENFNWGLSVEQLSKLRDLTKYLFPPPAQHATISPDNPLNLIIEGTGIMPSGMQHTSTNTHLETATREQWESVLTRYADEVWGGLLPLVKEARQEIEDAGHSSSGPDQPTALRRLGAILGHLQQKL